MSDWYKTEKSLDNPYRYEKNPILGKHPSDTKLGVYFSITALIILGICHYYPKLRYPLLFSFGTLGFGYAIHNININND